MQRSEDVRDTPKDFGSFAAAEAVLNLIALAFATGSAVMVYPPSSSISGAVRVTSTYLLSPD